MITTTNILNFAGYRLINLGVTLDNVHQYDKKEFARYKKEDPYEDKRVDYPLTVDSIVVDIGGLTGDWAQRIYCRYNCNIAVFEPHPVLSAQAMSNFRGNPKVIIYPIALGKEDGALTLYGDNPNASLFRNSAGKEYVVKVCKTSDTFRRLYLGKKIDLVKINVEGSEYDILPDLIGHYDMTSIRDIQIQFHSNVSGWRGRRNEIREYLAATHKCNWCYETIFENWTLK
jgi:FkbM family methyltransferase